MKRLRNILKSKSGASMILVLCAAFLLMAIGVSAMIAASSAVNMASNQRDFNQMEVYGESVIKTFTKALQSGKTEVTTTPKLPKANVKTLGNQLIFTIYESSQRTLPYDNLPKTLDFSGVDAPAGMVTSVELLFEKPFVEVIPSKPLDAVYGREPRQANVNTYLTVRVNVTYKGKSIITFATYEFTSGQLEDDGVNEANMLLMSAGEWRLVSSAKTEVQVI